MIARSNPGDMISVPSAQNDRPNEGPPKPAEPNLQNQTLRVQIPKYKVSTQNHNYDS